MPDRGFELAYELDLAPPPEAADLEATAGGTRARFVDRVWPTSLPGRLLVGLSGGIMRRDLRARAARLRDLLEGSAPTVRSP